MPRGHRASPQAGFEATPTTPIPTTRNYDAIDDATFFLNEKEEEKVDESEKEEEKVDETEKEEEKVDETEKEEEIIKSVLANSI